jgi:phosphoribosylglycinamide formyltransferase-1
MKRLAILLSGRGSNFEALADSITSGRIRDAEIAVVISNRPGARGLETARSLGLTAVLIASKGVPRTEHDRRMIDELSRCKVDLICLAGYMRLLSPEFVRAFSGRILNIHPSLLPSFPGLDAQRQALDHGVKVSGCTVHFVDEGLDSGAIILQAAVPVLDGDTEESLSARILKEEHQIYSEAVDIILNEAWRLEGRRLVRLESTPG